MIKYIVQDISDDTFHIVTDDDELKLCLKDGSIDEGDRVYQISNILEAKSGLTLVGGKKESKKRGGIARAKKLSPKRRSEIAKKAANTRWQRVK